MKPQKSTLILVIALVLIAITLSAVTTGFLTIKQKTPAIVDVCGKISSTADIGVYAKPDATTSCTNFDCGLLAEGSTATEIIYVKNSGNVSETLTMIPVNLDPLLAGSPLTLSWSREGTTLAAGAIMPATLTLKVSENVGSFSDLSFNVVVVGTT